MRVHGRRKEIFSVFVLVALAMLSYTYVHLFVPQNYISDYYGVINTQESVENDTQVSDDEWATLRQCKALRGEQANMRRLDCITRFYEQYTLKNGVRKAFAHLAALELASKDFIEDCHYVSHGIGHAQLRVNNWNAAKSFAELSENLFFKNVSTCGNGYFHGVIEELARPETEKEGLIALLKPVCEAERYSLSDCYHGIGHAAFIQLEYKLEDSLEVCDRISTDPFMQYSCHMGIFMEMAQDFNWKRLVDVKGDSISFRTCDVQKKDIYKEACYSQFVSFYEELMAHPSDYKTTMLNCQKIEHPRFRLACIKFFAGKAVRAGQYTDVEGLCVDTTSSRNERVMCVAAFGNRIARAIDSKKGALFTKVTTDICKHLPFYDVHECIDLSLYNRDKIYYDPAVTGVM